MLKVLLFFLISLLSYSSVFQKDFLYNKYTLKDKYQYGKINREFQWGKIEDIINSLEDFENRHAVLGSLSNYKNYRGEAPLINGKAIDSDGVPRYQGIPLYSLDNLEMPVKYGRDGSLVAILGYIQGYRVVRSYDRGGMWYVPNKYVKKTNTKRFKKVIVIDTKNQNICSLEKLGNKWVIRSMNPATTGLNKPPFYMATPKGTYVVQGKRHQMFYLKDGTEEIDGYAPYATRFTRGAYVHGVPVQFPRVEMLEYSPTLGTFPRSHMCVRNTTSHAEYLYKWAEIDKCLVVVI
ncbi:L,D-transpeptidase catalytic domain [Cetobacterium ceti]|uniref:L,D-transpeptidase catalytic domain n=1 Tax=Cetobacterium ceti TaxID=180163 RepID=A0A1T4MXD6_9FUSO|nr:L,D-transpeptidase [Cetobacterium ceti]SJZ71719.1 L,D-transpeptidase catalytic domain [Cetobacterium ceti]